MKEIRQHLHNKRLKKHQIEQEIIDNQSKLTRAEKRLLEVEVDLAEKERLLNEATRLARANPTYENKQAVHNEEQRIALAKVTIKSRLAAAQRLSRREQELEAQLAQVENAIVTLQDRIAHVKTVAEVEQQHSALTAQMEALKAENARLAERARLAEQAALNAAAQLESAQANEAIEPEPQPEEELTETALPNGEQLASLDSSAIALFSDTDLLNAVVDPEDDSSAARYAQAELERLREILANSKAGKGDNGFLLSGPGLEEDAEFEHLGEKQYRAEAVVQAGTIRFSIRDRSYRATIPESDDGEVYVFLYDLRNSAAPRLATFKKALIEDSSRLAGNTSQVQ